jgi:hypothetical protein
MQKFNLGGLVVLLLLAACETGGRPTGPKAPSGGDAPKPKTTTGGADGMPRGALPESGPYAISQGNAVLWKRHAALEADLTRALELAPDQVCKELGERNCIRDIHVIALGGNDPFRSGINRPPSRPLSTTSIVVDRVLLSACSARARADKVKPARVFTELDLQGPAPAPEAAAVDATIRTLFRRLLVRDPKPSEAALIKALLDPNEPDGPQSAEEFATLACFAIGSSLEFLFL